MLDALWLSNKWLMWRGLVDVIFLLILQFSLTDESSSWIKWFMSISSQNLFDSRKSQQSKMLTSQHNKIRHKAVISHTSRSYQRYLKGGIGSLFIPVLALSPWGGSHIDHHIMSYCTFEFGVMIWCDLFTSFLCDSPLSYPYWVHDLGPCSKG